MVIKVRQISIECCDEILSVIAETTVGAALGDDRAVFVHKSSAACRRRLPSICCGLRAADAARYW